MNLNEINAKGLVLLGCGKMGSAMLRGWLERGLDLKSVTVVDPFPSAWVSELAAKGLRLNTDLPPGPAVVLIAVKPQMMGEALPQVAKLGGTSLIVTVAAGTMIASYEAAFGPASRIIVDFAHLVAVVAVRGVVGRLVVPGHGLASCS